MGEVKKFDIGENYKKNVSAALIFNLQSYTFLYDI